MADDLARRLKQTPPHGLYLRALPAVAEHAGAKAEIEIIGQHSGGKKHGVGFECPTRHGVHAEADLQRFDAVFAGLAMLVIACGVLRHADTARHFSAFVPPVPKKIFVAAVGDQAQGVSHLFLVKVTEGAFLRHAAVHFMRFRRTW